ncbi:MAG: FAD-dependent oxidoreductase [Jatrophihabitans sp.]
MSDKQTFVIVGAGLAGAKAAQTLREEGFDGRVLLLGDEPARPYDHVPLSKQYLHFEPGFHKLYVHDEGYYAAHGIDLRMNTRVSDLDTSARRVQLDSGEQIDYDALLLTTGAEPRRLRVPGSELLGIHYLRTLADAEKLRDALKSAGRVVVIGAGWIGCEVASSARGLGLDVTLVGRSALPLERTLGQQMATFYRDLHAEHGVDLRMGVDVIELRGAGTVEAVVLSDGQVLPADLVVVGIGALPRTALAERAELAVHNGIVTDERMATSNHGVFAAGDVANAWHPALGRRLRLEHWSAALNQGPVAARNMMGLATTYSRVPFFFSDQYDVWMEYSGDATDADRFVVRRLSGEREFIAFWLRDQRVVAGMNVNIRDIAPAIAALVASKAAVDPAALTDPDVEVRSLVVPS